VGAGYVTGASIVSDSLRTTVRRGSELEDAEIWWAKHPMATIWVGQGKVPFAARSTRRRASSSSSTAGSATPSTPGRDQGIRLEGMNEAKTFEYAVGA